MEFGSGVGFLEVGIGGVGVSGSGGRIGLGFEGYDFCVNGDMWI